KVHPPLFRPLGEQRDRVRVPRAWRAVVARIGKRQRRHAVSDLAVDVQRLAAGGQQVDPGATPQNGVGDLRARVDQVLAVVQQYQQVLGAKGVEQGFQ